VDFRKRTFPSKLSLSRCVGDPMATDDRDLLLLSLYQIEIEIKCSRTGDIQRGTFDVGGYINGLQWSVL
jgi:hypothetical protein